jgi:hypothetical protein
MQAKEVIEEMLKCWKFYDRRPGIASIMIQVLRHRVD